MLVLMVSGRVGGCCWWSQEDPKHYHDAKRVIECLQRSVKTADMCIASSQHINLFVEVSSRRQQTHHDAYIRMHHTPPPPANSPRSMLCRTTPDLNPSDA